MGMAQKAKSKLDPLEKVGGEGAEKVKKKGKSEAEPKSMKVVVVKR